MTSPHDTNFEATQPPIPRTPGAKPHKHTADHSPLSNAIVYNVQLYLHSPVLLHGVINMTFHLWLLLICIFITATCYRLNSPGIESRWMQDFPCCQDRPQNPSTLLYNGYHVFPGGKEAGAWCWSHSSFKCQLVNGEKLYLHLPSVPAQAHQWGDLIYYSYL
jgi:hypothetical protein